MVRLVDVLFSGEDDVACAFHFGGGDVVIHDGLQVGSWSDVDPVNAAAENGVCGTSKLIHIRVRR